MRKLRIEIEILDESDLSLQEVANYWRDIIENEGSECHVKASTIDGTVPDCEWGGEYVEVTS
jgi:hypothetical protein